MSDKNDRQKSGQFLAAFRSTRGLVFGIGPQPPFLHARRGHYFGEG